MIWKKVVYTSHLVFPDGTVTKELYAHLTEKQAENIATWLNSQRKRWAIRDFYLGPPPKWKPRHLMIFNVEGLRSELQSIIEDHERLTQRE